MLKAPLLAPIFALVCSAQITGSISGSIATPAGEPVRGAGVRLTLEGSKTPYFVFSDAQGHFLFDDMPPGSYSLCSEKPNYLYGCYRDERRRQNFTLAAGQKRTDINLQLTPQAVISGRLVDENGDPVDNVRVETVRRSVAAGRKVLSTAGLGGRGTDAEGNFAIGGLPAGTYYVRVDAQPPRVNDIRSAGWLISYVTTYYPGVTDFSKAVAVHVDAGQTVRNVEIRVTAVRGYRIDGRVTAAETGAVLPMLDVRLISVTAADSPAPLVSIFTRGDRTFSFDNVLPGAYSLEVKSPAGLARQSVSVGNADVAGLVLQLTPPPVVAGTVVMEGSSPNKLNPEPIVRLVDCCSRNGAQSANGFFTLRNFFPGTYRVEVESLPRDAYVKSIRFGEQDVTNAQLDLTPRGGVLNIVLAPDAAQVRGTVHRMDGTPVDLALVALWKSGTDFARTAYANEAGQFTFFSLPPGEYRIAASEVYDPDWPSSPALRAKFESQAALVNLLAYARGSVDPPLLSKEAIDAEAAKLP